MSSIPITSEPELSASARLRLACALASAGWDLMREQLRREHPDADEAELERRVAAWFQERPGAEHGDTVGHPAPERLARLVRDAQ